MTRKDAEAVHRAWAERTGEYSPGYYAYYGSTEVSERIRGALAAALDRDAAVLELGCSSGRHLSHLHDRGFRNLAGIDLNEAAFDVMERSYPDLAADGTFYRDTIETVVSTFADDQFDAVYSVETLQHIHPESEWVFEEIARITDTVLITVEVEADDGSVPGSDGVNFVREDVPLYYRDWGRIFTRLGFEQTDQWTVKKDTGRVFRSDAG